MIKSVDVTTDNVSRELLRIAAQNSTSVSELYIKINSVVTFIKIDSLGFEEINHNDFDKYKSEPYLRDEDVAFAQEYDIEINSKYENYQFKDMISEIELKERATLAYFVIKKGSKLDYYNDLYSDFLSYITEQQLKSNIMLYMFDVDYKESIKQLVDIIEKVKNITFKEDKKILISKGLQEIESVNAETVMTIEINNSIGNEDNQGKVDYANRGFLLSCTEGEELFKFRKPQQGKHGRNCKGEIIEVEIVDLNAKPIFTVEDNIEVQDSFENIKYLSGKSGYLIKSGEQYDVSNSIEVDEISFKTTGTINTDLESEISISVIKENPLEDAIEEGMHVKVQNLSIVGSIGPESKIETRDISITGQTHNSSSIKCINADIKIHKGKLIGRKVEVKVLDGGEIIADTAIVKNAMRGKIKAKTIEIGILGSRLTIEASELIQIQRVKGEENKFIIDSLVNSGLDDNKKDDKAYLKKTEEELKSLLITFKKTALKVKNNLAPCEKIKAIIIKDRNLGVKTSLSIIEKFKICRMMQVHYKKLREDVTHQKNQYEELKKKAFSTSSNILDAKIVLDEPLKGFNHIKYKLYKPQIEITLNTDESMNKKIFKLIEDDDGVMKIVNIS